ncbi:MAG: glycosyltransferase [Anaerolineae bacterium]|nr:glycosyltransferase [Anaerolineae bacterium]NIO00300.1 glycosyltransferase [Anaerolineae bacterium]NIQ83078.1 glycosyltransferase [Anaerolineae bacterium]
MNSTKPDVSVIIVAWNVGDLLAECLRSLQAASQDIRTEIVVVDNGSVDRTAQLVERQFPHVRLIVNEENIGFTRGNNLGIKQSSGRYILLLNADTVVRPDTLERLVGFMDETPDAGIAGCKQTYADGSWQPTCHRMICLKREAIVAAGLSKVFPQLVDYGDLPLKATEAFRVDWVGGACLMMRRQVAEQVGLLDESIFIYGEDADLCERARNAGYSVYYLPGVSIVHHRGQSDTRSAELTPSVDYSALRLKFIGRRYVIEKHYGNLKGDFYYAFMVVRIVRMLLQDSVSLLLPQPVSRTRALSVRRRECLAMLKAALTGRM